MNTIGKYVFDNAVTLEKSYELLCLFFADKEISRRTHPNEAGESPLLLLEKRFFEAKVSRLLIEIAASLRVMDDQIMSLADEDPTKVKHKRLLNEVDAYDFGLFDDLGLTFRQTCNKIIHSEIFEIPRKEGDEPHEHDIAFREGMGDQSIQWSHVTDYVRLAGKMNKKQWHVLLNIEIFVSAIVALLAD